MDLRILLPISEFIKSHGKTKRWSGYINHFMRINRPIRGKDNFYKIKCLDFAYEAL